MDDVTVVDAVDADAISAATAAWIRDAWNTLGWRIKQEGMEAFGKAIIMVRRDMVDDAVASRAYPATSGRRARSGRTSRQSSPSNSAASCADDIRITPSRTCGQTNLPPSSRL